MYKITRILLIFLSLSLIFGQTAEELKRFMDTYDKIKVDQQANDIVKKGIDSEKDSDDGPVRLIIEPGDMTKYYREKMNVIKKDLDQLNKLLIPSDSIPPLLHFGYNYFSLRDSINYIDNNNVTENYVLGYGDEIIISVWGQAEQYERKTLERDGTIFIDNVGLMYFGGKTQKQAKLYSLKRFSKVYATLNSDPQLTFLELSIGKIKNINVSVSGHVQYPGNHVVNPSISIPNILILAGGINSTGSLRNIYLQRGDSIVDTLDLYPLITGVGVIRQIPIFEGDIIVVPPRSKTVAITGNILNPAYFEVKSNETVSKVMKYAGTITNFNDQQAIIARTDSENLFISKSDFEKTLIFHGDSLIVPITYRVVKTISVSVANRSVVSIPWSTNLSFFTILDIISVDFDNIETVELIRRNTKNNMQEPHPFNHSEQSNFRFVTDDHLSIHLSERFTPTKFVIVKGEINSPGSYPLINIKETLSSIINRAGGLQSSTNISNVTVTRDTITFGSIAGELILAPGDTIIAKQFVGTIEVQGEVHNPGYFEWMLNAKAKDYISFAGGLTSYGDKKHIVYITPYGEATRISQRSNIDVLPGSTIRISEKPLSEQKVKPDRFQQISSLVTSLVSIAILANASTN